MRIYERRIFMGKELKIYRMTDQVMKKTASKVNYDVVLSEVKSYYQKKPRFLGLFTHVGDSYAADVLSKKLLRNLKV